MIESKQVCRLSENISDANCLLLVFVPCSVFVKASAEDPADVQLCEAMLNFSLKETSIFQPESQSSNSSSGETDDDWKGKTKMTARRSCSNDFLRSCDEEEVGPYKKPWREASIRTRNARVIKARTLVVAGLNVIAPGDAGYVWEALRDSGTVEKELGLTHEGSEEKYLKALAETYHNAQNWETRRQILSIMADLITFKNMQNYIPGLTEYRFKMARQHEHQWGRGSVICSKRSPRLRVSPTQLDHFLVFITSPHVVQDLPYGQRYLRLSSGEIVETPNVIRTMVPSRLVRQYQAYCDATGFSPFGEATMLRILSACSATVRTSLQGLDYIAVDGAKGFDDLCNVVKCLEEKSVASPMANWKTSLKECKQYLKSDYKVMIRLEKLHQLLLEIRYSQSPSY